MKIAFIGFGEAADAFLSGWGPDFAHVVATFDVKLEEPATAGEIEERAARRSVTCCGARADALRGADLIFSAVTADQAVAAAEACAPHVPTGAIWCDLNSCSPGSIRRAAAAVEGGGGRYIDIAVMEPVRPKRNLAACLLAGAEAEAVAPLLAALPMSVRVVGATPGQASAIKMIRSIMVKGLEALTAECALAAVAAGVEGEVMPSLKEGHPGLDVPERAAYNFERSLRHGARRAAEMDEVAATLDELRLPNGMTRATAAWQRRISQAAAAAPDAVLAEDYREIAERLLAVIAAEE